MSSESQRPFINGHAIGGGTKRKAMDELNRELKAAAGSDMSAFHGDELLADKLTVSTGTFDDLRNVVTWENASEIGKVAWKKLTGQGLDMVAGSQLVGSLPADSANRAAFIETGVVDKYEKMLHPPLTYLGDAFQYRTADGKFNSVLNPHLGQAGAPYAKTVPSKTPVLGALPDPGDIFDRLMARDEKGTRESESGLSSMLVYHATIIIHDIFRTNDKDKNISDSSSYLDLSPLYGYTTEMQRKVRDDKYKLGLLKPDTFAEDRLLRQPPGVCIMLVMYNRYHNYAATQLRRINENGRFSVPSVYAPERLVAVARACIPAFTKDSTLQTYLDEYQDAQKQFRKHAKKVPDQYTEAVLQKKIETAERDPKRPIEDFEKAYDAAWNKLDDDLFNTARLITCGIYVNISIHDYLRALMGFHKYNTDFTLDPRVAINKNGQRDAVSRGIGNQVTTEFNLLYRFHCAISDRDEKYTEKFMKQSIGAAMAKSGRANWDPKTLSLAEYLGISRAPPDQTPPWLKEFGLKDQFPRNSISGLFNDQSMVTELIACMDAKLANFGALNVPRCLRPIEEMGIIQARKWEVGTLNDFRDFFGMKRHKDFKSITGNVKVQNALRDLYDHPDKVELYPGIFCEGSADMNLDPGPNEKTFALWAAIFSDAITLVRSDRFYTVDWNTNSLTSWGMREVTPQSDVMKSSVFHRLIQRAFPEWFPFNSIRFFHPFYTGQQNAAYAKEQGYEKDFRMKSTWVPTEGSERAHYDYSYTESNPQKPVKPIYFSDFAQVKAVLDDKSGIIRSSASFDKSWLPEKIADLLAPGNLKPKPSAENLTSPDKGMLLEYFTTVTREIINREVYAVDEHTYQIDVTRDLAIPVITTYIADFLGFRDRVRTVNNLRGEFSENQIYQHITNVQVFLAYNADETKMWERRVAAQKSMIFLMSLAEGGNIKAAASFSSKIGRLFGATDPLPKNMNDLGKLVARQTLERENNDSSKAAAVLLLTALDGAYNSVLAFSAVLSHFMDDLYAEAKAGRLGKSQWRTVQGLALEDRRESDATLRKMVLNAQRLSVKLPVVRKVAKSGTIKKDLNDKNGKDLQVTEGQIIICDVHRAYEKKMKAIKSKVNGVADSQAHEDYLIFGSSLSEGFDHFNARETAILGLTAMIKVLAQTKNLRRGHDTQGRLKRINIDETEEGYANYMAPKRMVDIRERVRTTLEKAESRIKEATKVVAKAKSKTAEELDEAEKALVREKTEQKDAQELRTILDSKVLQPEAETYLTPEWDEMIPFPTTWKMRFDGYGESDYTNVTLNKPSIPDDEPPFYQPKGPSHYGGSFAEVVCANNDVESKKKAEGNLGVTAPAVPSAGCGAPGANMF